MNARILLDVYTCMFALFRYKETMTAGNKNIAKRQGQEREKDVRTCAWRQVGFSQVWAKKRQD